MAINQLVIFLLPKSWGNSPENFHLLFDEEGYFSSEKVWEENSNGIDPLSILNSTFETKGEFFWNSHGANDYSIEVTENGAIVDLRIRIDCGNYSEGELKRILSLAHVLECNLFFPEFSKIIEPNQNGLESISLLIKGSRGTNMQA